MDTLADIFNPWPSYEFDDLYGSIGTRDLIVRSRHVIALLRQRLDNLESALARRGLRLTVYNDLAVAYEDTMYHCPHPRRASPHGGALYPQPQGYSADDLCSAWHSYNWST